MSTDAQLIWLTIRVVIPRHCDDCVVLRFRVYSKVNSFAAGKTKKSKREREKEVAEAKRLQEQQDAAKAYRDFVASFDDDAGRSSSTSGRANDTSRGFKGFVKAGGSSNPVNDAPTGPRGYRPQPAASTSQQLSSGMPSFTSSKPATTAVFGDDEEEAKPTMPVKKKRAMDSYLEELKRDQADREHRLQSRVVQGVATSVSAAAAEDLGRGFGGGSHDNGDPLTTNLHVGNLPANVTTNSIGLHFAQFGPVASVKIMWPRDAVGGFGMASNVAATRGGLNGFIAFMRRADAAKAMEQCDGKEWGGSVLTLGWGKAMALPPRPAFVVDSPYQRSARSPSPDYSNKRSRRSPSPDRRYGPRNGDDRKRNRRSRSRSIDRHRSGRRSRSRSRSFSDDGRGYRRSRSPPPRERRWPKLDNEEQIYLLEGVARKIQQHGKRFEETLRDKEKRNPTYDFLRNESLPAYHYFRMLLDSRYRAPSPPPPAFEEDGEMSVVTSDDSQYEDEMKKGKKGALGRLPRRKLESMLRNLTNTRDKIARIMVFALDRPDAAEEVVDVLIQSLIIPETPVPRKLARLNAISDILHNCAGVPTNAWKYRSIFEARLPAVFDHFGEIHRSFPGRMKAEIFRKQVMTVVQVWEDWLVFTPAVLSDFEARLSAGSDDGARADADDGMPLGASEPEVKIEPKVKPSAAPTPVKAIKPGFKPAGFVKIGTVDPAPKVEDDVDGDAMDLDGDSVDGDDIDGMPVA